MSSRSGILLVLGANVLWGTFPLYFPLMAPASSLEVLAHRVLWALVLCAALVTLGGIRRGGGAGAGWRPVLALGRTPRRLALLVVAAAAIAVNWGVYIAASTSGHVVEASLGYFINPLLTVLLAVLVLRERLRRLQWAAVATGVVAVVVLSVEAGRPPWISLVLAGSFGTYGLAKKVLGSTSGSRGPARAPRAAAQGPGGEGPASEGPGGEATSEGLGALTGLTAETLVLAPLAALALAVIEVRGLGHFAHHAPWHPLLLASTGVVTAVPLLMFAAAARRVPLATIGLLQYVTPVLQLVLGVLVLGEHVPATRWAGFALVWVALLVLAVDAVRAGRAGRARPDQPVRVRPTAGARG